MELRTSILKTVAYFDLFNYPISPEDIRHFLEVEAGQAEVAQVTEMLVRGGYLYRVGPYYSLQNNPSLAERRQRGEAHADSLLAIANRNARLLYKFPFVRGVCISGSLSKHFADEKADIDYFIVTKANRLWLARTFMLLYRRLTSLTGHLDHYCLNYYVDEEALEVQEKNIFTATELYTLLPAAGGESLARFFCQTAGPAPTCPGICNTSGNIIVPTIPPFSNAGSKNCLTIGLGTSWTIISTRSPPAAGRRRRKMAR